MLKRVASIGLFAAMACGPLQAQQPASEPRLSEREIIEQIMDHKRQIDELMLQLPVQRQHEVQARLGATPTSSPQAKKPMVGDVSSITSADEPEASTAARDVVPPVEPDSLPTEITRSATVPNMPTEPIDPATAPGPLPLLKRQATRVTCNTLSPLDENRDGQISSADRYWRYLYVWIDKNRDSQMQEREIESAFERGVRQIDAAVETFVRSRGSLGETRVSEHVVLDLGGDGFSSNARKDDGVLVIDASAIRRGNGPELLGPTGESLAGFQAFRTGLKIRESDDQLTPLTCP